MTPGEVPPGTRWAAQRPGPDTATTSRKTEVINTIVEIQNLSHLSRLLERLEAVRDVHTVARDTV